LNEIEEDDDFSFFVKRFNKFLRNKANQRRSNLKPKKRGEDSSSLPKCYECNQPGHLRVDCPSFKKRIERSEKKTVNRLLRLTFVYKSFQKCIYFSQFMVLFGRIVNICCLVFIFTK